MGPIVCEYGPPCFTNGSNRSIKVYQNGVEWKVFVRTTCMQCMREGVNEGVNEGVLSVFEEYKTKLKGDDKKLFKYYFDSI